MPALGKWILAAGCWPALAAPEAGLDRRAFEAYRQREWVEAVRLYEAHHAAGGGSASTYDYLGVALTNLGRLHQAEAALRKAIELDANHRWAYNHLGYVLRELGRTDEAIAMFERQIRIRPGDPYAYRNLAAALVRQGRFAEAEAVADEHERRTYERGAVYVDMACVLNSRRDTERAQIYLERARKAGAERSLLAQETAHYYLALGDVARAGEQYRKLLDYRPHDPLVALRLGALHFQTGDLDQAAAAFARVIEVDDQDRVRIRTSPSRAKTVSLAELRQKPDPGPLGDVPVDWVRAALLVRASRLRQARSPRWAAACEDLMAAERTAVVRSWCGRALAPGP